MQYGMQNLIWKLQENSNSITAQTPILFGLFFSPTDKEDEIHKQKICYLNFFDRCFKSIFNFQKEHTFIINISSVFNEDFLV